MRCLRQRCRCVEELDLSGFTKLDSIGCVEVTWGCDQPHSATVPDFALGCADEAAYTAALERSVAELPPDQLLLSRLVKPQFVPRLSMDHGVSRVDPRTSNALFNYESAALRAVTEVSDVTETLPTSTGLFNVTVAVVPLVRARDSSLGAVMLRHTTTERAPGLTAAQLAAYRAREANRTRLRLRRVRDQAVTRESSSDQDEVRDADTIQLKLRDAGAKESALGRVLYRSEAQRAAMDRAVVEQSAQRRREEDRFSGYSSESSCGGLSDDLRAFARADPDGARELGLDNKGKDTQMTAVVEVANEGERIRHAARLSMISVDTKVEDLGSLHTPDGRRWVEDVARVAYSTVMGMREPPNARFEHGMQLRYVDSLAAARYTATHVVFLIADSVQELELSPRVEIGVRGFDVVVVPVDGPNAQVPLNPLVPRRPQPHRAACLVMCHLAEARLLHRSLAACAALFRCHCSQRVSPRLPQLAWCCAPRRPSPEFVRRSLISVLDDRGLQWLLDLLFNHPYFRYRGPSDRHSSVAPDLSTMDGGYDRLTPPDGGRQLAAALANGRRSKATLTTLSKYHHEALAVVLESAGCGLPQMMLLPMLVRAVPRRSAHLDDHVAAVETGVGNGLVLDVPAAREGDRTSTTSGDSSSDERDGRTPSADTRDSDSDDDLRSLTAPPEDDDAMDRSDVDEDDDGLGDHFAADAESTFV